MMNKLNEAAALLPIRLNSELLILPEEEKDRIEEIRLRAGRPMTVLTDGSEKTIAPEYTVNADELEDVLECAAGASVHAVQSELSVGYLRAPGGIRLGVCGTAVMRSGTVSGVREISSISLRIPREHFGLAGNELKAMLKNGLTDILIISPPGAGKTSCLREYIRRISNTGRRVSVADERGEIAAVSDGIPQFDIGTHSDVMTEAPKASAAMMLLRSMNPEVLAMDEISSRDDMTAVYEAAGCGVKLLATAHAGGIEDLYKKRSYRELISSGIFRFCLVIENRGGKRSYSVKELHS